MRRRAVFLTVLIALLSSSLVTHAQTANSPVTSANALGFKLFARLAAGDSKNVLISPASVGLAMDVVFDASRGMTRQQMAATLGLGGMSSGQQRRATARLISALAGSKDTAQLETATSFWTRKQAPIRPAFESVARRYYQADVRSLDFTSPAAVPTINNWVKNATHGKIAKVISQISAETIAYLINAVYFKGQWTFPFPKQNTAPHPFAAPSGTTTVQMMHEGVFAPYVANKTAQVVSLPYGTKSRFAMVVALPRPGVSLNRVISRLTPSLWQSWTSHLTSTGMIDLGLPRFTFSYTTDLKPELQALGMRSVFDRSSADLAGICLVRCWVSSVTHKTYIHVDEKGTVAAGVTSVGIGATAVPATRAQMIVDRPFLVGITDARTGSILFLGAVRSPST